MTKTTCAMRAVATALALLAITAITESAQAVENPWEAGTSWLTMRAGYAKSSIDGAGGAGAGYAFGYTRMIHPVTIYKLRLFKKGYALGGFLQQDVLGRFGSAAEIMTPVTVELVRHFAWKTAVKPYLGIGAGAFYHKFYRTGVDTRTMGLDGYATFGGNVSVTDRGVLGLDFRFARVNTATDPPNPVFGPGDTQSPMWSAKVGYSIVY